MEHNKDQSLQSKLHSIIFEAETIPGRLFDLFLLLFIILSVFSIMLESVESINTEFGFYLHVIEWFFTILFTVEYILRIYAMRVPSRYVLSFFGLIDLVSILPTYIGFLFSGGQYFIIVRSLRLLRIFRILKLVQYLGEAEVLLRAIRASRFKIIVFMGFILILSSIMGTVMYVIEGPENGFTSIPRGIYWAIVTLTTVGYGDIAPSTSLGQIVSAFIMIMGYGILAVPTGIVSVELAEAKKHVTTMVCSDCNAEGHDVDAVHCKYCGGEL